MAQSIYKAEKSLATKKQKNLKQCEKLKCIKKYDTRIDKHHNYYHTARNKKTNKPEIKLSLININSK